MPGTVTAAAVRPLVNITAPWYRVKARPAAPCHLIPTIADRRGPVCPAGGQLRYRLAGTRPTGFFTQNLGQAAQQVLSGGSLPEAAADGSGGDRYGKPGVIAHEHRILLIRYSLARRGDASRSIYPAVTDGVPP